MAEREVTQFITANNRIRLNIYGAADTFSRLILQSDDPAPINSFYDYVVTDHLRSTVGQWLELQTRDAGGTYQNRIQIEGEVNDADIYWLPDGANARMHLNDTDWEVDVNATFNAHNLLETGNITPDAADTYNIGSADLEYENMYLGTGKYFMALDQAESMRSDGTDIIWEVAGGDELHLSGDALFPDAASGLDLGGVDNEWADAYIADRIYLYPDQGESIRSDGTNIVLTIATVDELKLNATALYPNVADGLDLGTVDNEWEDAYISDRIYLYGDQGESIRSDGTNIIWGISTADELKLHSTALYPNAASGLDLGTTDNEFEDGYIASHLYFFTDQGEYVYSDGSDLIFGVAGGDVMSVDATQILGAGLNLGAVGTQFGDAYIDGTAYIDSLTIEVGLDVDAIDINATGLGSVTAVVPVTAEAGTCYIALYDGYS